MCFWCECSRGSLPPFHRIEEIRAGVVTVNCCDEGDITMPLGGDKASGFGRAEYRSQLRHPSSTTLIAEAGVAFPVDEQL
ncbi:aldehyde dehydrogenase family protein [Cupriavidus sp. RAF12]|uniref:aldehyde dehydrogenase family protein n=1 Tax=Cupriavidus sp. RAF12 TaxID=3233050 RepID=UPI003F8EDB33